MNRSFQRLLAATALVACAGAAYFGWQGYSVREAWQAARPPLPAAAGAEAPGLDARLTACHAKLQSWPPDRAALAEFTRLCHANGNLPEAIAGYQALIRLEPGEPRWPHLLASILAGFGRLDDALPLFRRTAALSPDRPVVWIRLGDALLKSNSTAEAEAAYRQALQRAPDDPHALLGLARCDLQSDRWTSARRHLEQAVAGHPDFAGAQSLLATVFERLGNPSAAAAARARMQSEGRYTEAPDAWTAELAAWCYNPYSLLVTASAAVAEGRPRDALPALERALVLSPTDPRLHRQMGKTLASLGDPAGARACLEQAVRLAPADETMQLSLIALLRAQKDQATLERAVAAGVAACPDGVGLHFEAGLIAAGAGRYDEAAAHFKYTWQRAPDQTAAPRELAKAYFHSGRDGAGIDVLEKILGREPRDTAAHVLLVQHGIETGDARTATWFRHALAAGGPDLPRAELQQAMQRRFGGDYQ